MVNVDTVDSTLSVNLCKTGPSGIIVGDGTIAGERNSQLCKTKSLPTYYWTDIPLDRLRGQIRHSSRRDPSEGRAPCWYKVLLS